jgi:hypothetical protein
MRGEKSGENGEKSVMCGEKSGENGDFFCMDTIPCHKGLCSLGKARKKIHDSADELQQSCYQSNYINK